jgi:hypothetical protein
MASRAGGLCYQDPLCNACTRSRARFNALAVLVNTVCKAFAASWHACARGTEVCGPVQTDPRLCGQLQGLLLRAPTRPHARHHTHCMAATTRMACVVLHTGQHQAHCCTILSSRCLTEAKIPTVPAGRHKTACTLLADSWHDGAACMSTHTGT